MATQTTQNNPAVEKTLTAVQSQMGFVPALLNDLANTCPSAFLAYMQTSQVIEQNSSMNKNDRIATMLYVSALNKCNYCVAAHATQAKAAGMDPVDIDELSQGQQTTSTNFANITAFAKALWETHGSVTAQTVEQFEQKGLSQTQQLEIVTLYSLKVITNYGHHITQTAIDPQFQS